MPLPPAAHTSRPWRIHALTPDFHLEDVWALPTPGGEHDLPRLVAQFAASDFPDGAPRVVRLLWEARWAFGRLLGWDAEDAGEHAGFRTLRHRLPDDLRAAPTGPECAPFSSLYELEDEWAAELTNRTVHAVLHLGWVEGESGGHHAQMAVLVKPNGRRGSAYMAAIKPFRHLIVYPALLRSIARGWQAGAGAPEQTVAG